MIYMWFTCKICYNLAFEKDRDPILYDHVETWLTGYRYILVSKRPGGTGEKPSKHRKEPTRKEPNI